MKTDLIPRRTVLKGLGAVMALPWLEAMGLQTGWAAGNTPTKNAAPNRMAILYVPNGVNMDGWRVGAEGALPSKLPAILAPLNNVRSDFSILTGLTADKARAHGDGGGDHARDLAQRPRAPLGARRAQRQACVGRRAGAGHALGPGSHRAGLLQSGSGTREPRQARASHPSSPPGRESSPTARPCA
jgi:hypothetical protein